MLLTSQASNASDYTGDLGPGKLGVLFDLVMADFHLCLLEQRIPDLSGAAKNLKEGMQMLKASARLASILTDSGHDMQAFIRRVRKASQSLKGLATKRMIEDAAAFKLPQANGGPGTRAFTQDDLRLPSVVLPSPLQKPPAGGVGLEAARSRSKLNLAGLPPLETDPTVALTAGTLKGVARWVAGGHWAGDLEAQMVLGSIETLLFTTASSGSIARAASTYDAGDVARLERLVGSYKSVLANFSGGASRMSVELHSRETLVCWIAYAVVFAATRALWPEQMKSFGVCLRATDLGNMVLSDKLAEEAAREVNKRRTLTPSPSEKKNQRRTKQSACTI